MMRTLTFTKMHGAGNDFVMLDGRDLPQPLDRATIAALCDRRTGIGGDGLIVVAPPASAEASFRMIYFNADGGEAEMCGNGARCTVAFAAAHGLADGPVRFDTFSGVLDGRVHGPGDIEVSLPGWRDLELDFALPGSPWPHHHRCNTGVPHLVIPVPSVDEVDLPTWGPRLRRAPAVRIRRHQRQLGVARAAAGPMAAAHLRARSGGRDPGLRHWRQCGGGDTLPPGKGEQPGQRAHPRRRPADRRRGPAGGADHPARARRGELQGKGIDR